MARGPWGTREHCLDAVRVKQLAPLRMIKSGRETHQVAGGRDPAAVAIQSFEGPGAIGQQHGLAHVGSKDGGTFLAAAIVKDFIHEMLFTQRPTQVREARLTGSNTSRRT